MRIEHVAVYYRDLERAKEFFTAYFGGVPNEMYHNRKTGFRSYFLTFEGESRLEIMSKEDLGEREKELAQTGFIHMAFSVGSKEKVDELTGRLKGDGYHVVSGPRTTGDGYYESCVMDFEGNQIEITV